MAAMTEQHIVEIEGSNQVLGALALLLPHLMKAEAIECVRARIIVLHAVYQGLRGTDNEEGISTGSVCIHEAAKDTMLPAGIVVPSENVKSFIALRGMITGGKHCR